MARLRFLAFCVPIAVAHDRSAVTFSIRALPATLAARLVCLCVEEASDRIAVRVDEPRRRSASTRLVAERGHLSGPSRTLGRLGMSNLPPSAGPSPTVLVEFGYRP